LDRPDESIEAAALREAFEEVGVRSEDVDLLGRLTPIPIVVSGHLLHPVIGAAATRPDFTLAADEVDRLIELPIGRLLSADAVAWETRVRSQAAGGVQKVPYFDVEGARIWGATAMALAEFAALLDDFGVGQMPAR
jgi:8-oxo-dGTP pyrophosphatase MutT (NUDIX family)